MSFRVEVRVPEVKDALRQNKRDALNAIGISIAGLARQKSPVMFGVLRASIAWAIDGDPPQYPKGTPVKSNKAVPEGSQAVNIEVRAPKNGVIVGTNVVYARRQHEGVTEDKRPYNRSKMIEKGPRKGQMTPVGESKFLEKASNEFKPKILPTVRRALKGELR